jgi:hypothetical protein
MTVIPNSIQLNGLLQKLVRGGTDIVINVVMLVSVHYVTMNVG